MAGQYRFKDINGNIVAQISASSAGAISFSGSAVDFSNASTITLGQVQLAGTASNALLLDGFDSTAFVFTSSFNTISQSISSQITTLQTTSGSNIGRLNNLESKSSSVDISISNINSVTASNIARLSNLETKSSSVDISISSINQFTASNGNTSLNQFTASNDNTSLNSKTGSYATTGSNTFFGTQTYSGSVYIANDLIVQGSSSIQYISASSVSIGTNIVQLNTANPSIRFAGLTIIDSGSVGGSGSFLYDSVHDEFVFVHRGNGTNITSSHFVLGPETYDSLGNETYLTCNVLTKGTGKEHLVDSNIFDNGTTICLTGNTIGTGTACFGSAVCSCASSTLYAYFDGNNTVLPNPTDRPHIFRTSAGGLGLSANNEGAASQPISMYTCGQERVKILVNGTSCFTQQIDVTGKVITRNSTNIYSTIDGNTNGNLIITTNAGQSNTTNSCIIFQYSTSGGSITESMRIDNAGRVGIGTNTPCAVLHISNPAPYIYLTDTSTNGTRPTARIINGDVGTCQSLNFGFACNDGTTCGLDVITLNEKSNVGIGTNSPGTNLEICTPSQNCGNIRIYNGFNNGTNCFGLEFYRNYDAASNEIGGYVKYIRTGGSSGDLIFGIGERTTVNNRLRIEYTGVSCFSNNVCVGGNLVVNGATIQVNCSDTTNSDARINFYTRSASTGDRVSLYGYNLCAPTTNNEITYQALGYCTLNNQGYVNFQTKNTSGWCNTMILINGRVGIGNSSPLGKLHITTNGISASSPSLGWPVYNAEADANARLIYFETDGNGGTGTAASGPSVVLMLGSYFDSRVVITPAGAGGSSPSDQATGHGKDILIKGGTSDNTAGFRGGRLFLNGGMGYQSGYSCNVGHIIMQTIGPDGRVGIGTSSPGTRLHIESASQSYGQLRIVSTSGVSGEASMNFGRSEQGIDERWTVGQGLNGVGNTFAFYSSGNKATLTTAGVWSTTGGGTSDLRTKNEIDYNFDNGIESILRLRPTKFKFKIAPDKQRRGFIAQDVLEVIPDLVLGDGEVEGGTYGLDYDGILSLTVKALQETMCKIKVLESCIGIN